MASGVYRSRKFEVSAYIVSFFVLLDLVNLIGCIPEP
jgi:hypothetical protein